MIIALAILVFILLLTGVYFLVKDFSRFIIKKLVNISIPKEFVDLGENSVTWFIALSFSLLGLLFYKFAAALVSYLLSNNLTSFFIILRGVFTTKSELQDPFTFTHFISGLLLTPALQFITCYMIYRGIRTFMLSVNRRYNNLCYNEGDVLYFGFISVIGFIFFEIAFYIQTIPGVSGVVHLTYLAVSKLSFICYFLAVAHVRLLKNENYRSSLPTYVELNNRERKVLFTPWKTIMLSYFIGLILYLPFITGTQFLDNNGIVIFIYLLSCSVFYMAMKFFLSNGFNFLGVIMLVESPDDLPPIPKFPGQQTMSKLLLGLGLIGLLFAIAKPKLFFLIICFTSVGLLAFMIFHTLVYLTALGISLLRARHLKTQLPEIKTSIVSDYLFVTGTAMYRAATSMLTYVIVILMLFSVFPKKYQCTNENYINSVFDREGYPLFIEYMANNGCIPVPKAEIPYFFLKCLYLQEDRNFLQQDSWFPKKSNWHGISPSIFYRFLTGGGGSNINMQLIKNVAFPKSFPQDIQRKFSETLTAYQLSLQCPPQQIVTNYLNEVGMNGGQGQTGVMAASLYTFGLPVKELNNLEIMYLVVTLKRGAYFKTDSGYINYNNAALHSQEIKKTLLEQAKSWYKQALISKKELNTLKDQELRFINSRYNSKCQTTTKEFLSNQLAKIGNKAGTYKSSISVANQQALQTAVNDFNTKYGAFQKNGTSDLYSAALVVEISTGEIIGHYGSKGIADITTLSGGSDMGSLIKPFILCSLLEIGFTENRIRLFNGPIEGQRTPQNYNRHYSYKTVGIDEALGKSINAALVNVRLLTGPIELFKNVEDHFNKMGIATDSYLQLNDPLRRTENILNYPLGSRNMTLYNIAQAYQALLNNGHFIKLSALQSYYDPYKDTVVEIPKISSQVYAEANANRIRSALHYTMIEGGTGNHLNKILEVKRMFYAKTGTTSGSKAGYTVLSDGKTLIVTYVSYGKVVDDHLRLGLAPIPFGAGGRSAGVLAALIYNEFCKK